jgi:hypothetical protein
MKKFSLKGVSVFTVSAVLSLAAVIGLVAPGAAIADDCIRAWPSVTTTSATTQAGYPGDTLTFSMTVTNNDSVGCYASEFTGSINNMPYDWSPSLTPQGAVVVGPQESVDFSVAVTSADWALNGPYDTPIDVVQHYLDPVMTDDYFGFTQHFTYKVVGSSQTDPIAPGVEIMSPTDGASIKRNTAVLINARVIDNIGVTSMTYSVNGVTLCSGVVSPLCSWQPTKKGIYTILVTAHDAAGNMGSDSVTVSVR